MFSTVQLSLFDDASHMEALTAPCAPIEAARRDAVDNPIVIDRSGVVRLNLGPKLASRPRRRSPPSRLLTARDMPSYPEAEVATVERVIAEAPSERLLLGYREIQELFGVSKATTNRRMKDGLVPGVTLHDGVVSRDGSVRRFTREQVKFLLLAVRSTRRTIAEVAE